MALPELKIFNPAEIDAQIQREKSAQMQNKLAELMLGQKQQEIEQGNALMRVTREAFDPTTGKLDANKYRTGLGQTGNYAGLQKFEADQASLAKTQREAEKERIAMAKSQVELIGQVAGAAKDPQSYAAGLQTLAQAGVDISKIPQQYDPAYVAQARNQALTASQQLDQHWKKLGFDLDVSKFGETQRHNRTQEGIAGGNLSVARGNLAERQRENAAKTGDSADGMPAKPLPVAALKLRVEAQDAADTAEGINERLTNVEGRIASGKLSFGPIKNAINSGLNAAGMSTQESRNFASFKSELEKMRNDSLRLNKGVQTDGDAQRAWNELFQNINDTELVKQRLSEIKQINERAKNLRLMEVDTINRNYGGTSKATTSKPPAGPNVDDLLKKYGG